MPGELIVLDPIFKEDNKYLASRIRDAAKICDEVERPIAAVGVAVAFENGAVATMYEGSCYTQLLGALEVLRTRIMREFE